MANAWDGATPVQADDGPTQLYELGVDATVLEDITVTGVRVWHGAASNTVSGRSARLWTTGGGEIDVVGLDDALTPGWTEYPLDVPLERAAGAQFVLSYSTRQYYGATAGGFPVDSADGAVRLTGGRFRDGATGLFPTAPSATFYGVDLVYDLGIGGNVAPTVELAVSAAGRTVTATATVTDESPETVSYRWDWGDGTSTIGGAGTEQHTYAGDAIYAVLVTVTDSGGLKASAAAPVVASAGLSGGMSLSAVMLALAERLDTIPGLKVYTGWPDKVVAPAAIVVYPSSLEFDAVYARGSDNMELPIVVVLSRISGSDARDAAELAALDGYVSGSGPRSIKAVVESGAYVAMKAVHVADANIDVYAFNGVDHLTAVFGVQVMG